LLCYTSYYGHIFSCEDKADDATGAQVGVDVNKLTNLRVKILQYWREILPIPTAINQVEAIGAQFHGLTLNYLRLSNAFYWSYPALSKMQN
jgi:hypothetical protein